MLKQQSRESCIQACWLARHECQEMLYSMCLEEGGDHAAPEHIKLMADCIEICQTTADFMVRRSPLHTEVCRACAEICEACADSCEEVGEMDSCVEACRRCAAECRKMSGRLRKAG